MEWRICDTGSASAEENMAIDRQWLHALHPEDRPLLRFYDWDRPCFTHGYFIDPMKYLRKAGIEKWELQGAKRPTGGGITLHRDDFVYSLFLPVQRIPHGTKSVEIYHWIHQQVRIVLHSSFPTIDVSLFSSSSLPSDARGRSFCMALPVQNDLAKEGKKIGGGALRRTKNGWLYQGFIALQIDSDSLLEDIFHEGSPLPQEIHKKSTALCGLSLSTFSSLSAIKGSLKRGFVARLGNKNEGPFLF